MTPISRRGVLATIAAGIAGSAAARPEETPQYVVEQGDRCLPITPLSTDQTVEAFYDYRTPNTSPSGPAYSSYGTTDLQRPETSVCFLYDGPEGLSLVLLHDKLNDGTNGGAVTFRLGFENPDRGAWVVGDDDYDAPTNYDSFTHTDEGWRIDWTWAEGRSDGGVYRPLGDDFALTIDPAFNEEAALYGDHYEGEITDWQVLSGDRSDPDRFSLALDRPLTIRPGSCGERTTTTTTTTTDERERDGDRSSDPISADVEIVPGKVNPRSHGRLPVVVHSSEEFDATSLTRGTIEFGPREASPVKRIGTDANGDRQTDLKLHFWMDDIDWDTDEVVLTGETDDGRDVVGVTEVELIPAGSEDDESDDEDGEETEVDDDEETEVEREDDERETNKDDDEEEGEDEEEDGEDDDKDEDGRAGRGSESGNDRGRGNGNGGDNGRGNGRGKGRGNDNRDDNGRESGRGKGRGKGGDE